MLCGAFIEHIVPTSHYSYTYLFIPSNYDHNKADFNQLKRLVWATDFLNRLDLWNIITISLVLIFYFERRNC